MERDRQTAIPPEPAASGGSVEAVRRSRLRHLDGLRALAALTVLLHHTYLQIWPFFANRQPEGLAYPLLRWMYYGHFAVPAFLVLSGYCLMLPVLEGRSPLPGNAPAFYRARARRLLPPYYCALGMSLLLIALAIGKPTGTHWDIALPVTPLALGGHVLMLQDVLGAPRINHVFWSIAAECQICLLFPALTRLWQTRGPVAGGAIVFAATYATAVSLFLLPLPLMMQAWGSQLIGLVFLFAFGMAGATLAHAPRWAALRRTTPWPLLSTLAAALLLAACLVWSREQVLLRRAFLDVLVGISIVTALVGVADGRLRKLEGILCSPPLTTIGAFSYSLYLVHAPLLQLVWQSLINGRGWHATLQFAVLATAGTPLIIAAAYVFYLGCERPFRPALQAARQPGAKARAIAAAANANVLAAASSHGEHVTLTTRKL